MLLVTTLATHVANVVAADPEQYGEAAHWILVLDCYSVHIGSEFIGWCKDKYPHLVLLFIPANCTAWIQPLDISFNGPFKHILRNQAGQWLANHVSQQLRQVDCPSKVKLDLRLNALKRPFTQWVAQALEQMQTRKEVVKRGWDESGMGKAMDLAESKGKDCEEYKIAVRLEAEGKLFEKYIIESVLKD